MGPETIHNTYESIFVTGISHWTTASSVKSISGVIFSGNAPGSIKWPYFDTIILSTLKKIKRFQTGNIDVFFSEILTLTTVSLKVTSAAKW